MSFGLVAAAGIGLIGGIMSSGAQQDQAKQNNQYTQQDQELNFQRQAWLAQQQREWQLQDRQFKAQSIAEFAGDWGGNQSNITPANQNAEMGSLDQFDPNKLGSVGATPPPGSSASAPPASAAPPLSQLDPNKAAPPMIQPGAGGGVY